MVLWRYLSYEMNFLRVWGVFFLFPLYFCSLFFSTWKSLFQYSVVPFKFWNPFKLHKFKIQIIGWGFFYFWGFVLFCSLGFCVCLFVLVFVWGVFLCFLFVFFKKMRYTVIPLQFTVTFVVNQCWCTRLSVWNIQFCADGQAAEVELLLRKVQLNILIKNVFPWNCPQCKTVLG